jgi:hypothetical protein
MMDFFGGKKEQQGAQELVHGHEDTYPGKFLIFEKKVA